MAKKNVLTTSDYLPYEEFKRLLGCLRKDKEYFWELYATVSFCTACRSSDVLNLHWGDILQPSLVITEKKTQKTRPIKLNASTQTLIAELYRLMGSPRKDRFVFRNRATDKPVTIQYVNKKFKFFKEKYGIAINNFSTHTFRKTFGRYVYEKENHSANSLLLLNKILNHSSISVTKTYICITQDEIDDVFNSIQL